MPRAMNLVLPMEIVVTRNTTYILMEYLSMLRRIYTDGRSFPTDEEPSWMGYSIGKWIDEDGDGRFDVFEVETRNLKNPRTFDPSGCRCTTMPRLSSTNGSISTRRNRTSSTTR